MTCMEIILVILAVGFVSMIEICAVMTCVGRVLDTKMRTQVELNRQLFKEEMEAITKLLDTYLGKITEMVKS